MNFSYKLPYTDVLIQELERLDESQMDKEKLQILETLYCMKSNLVSIAIKKRDEHEIVSDINDAERKLKIVLEPALQQQEIKEDSYSITIGSHHATKLDLARVNFSKVLNGLTTVLCMKPQLDN